MYAVIKTGGKQYRVAKGDKLRVEKLPGNVGDTVTFGEVLLIGGEALKLGKPLVAGAKRDSGAAVRPKSRPLDAEHVRPRRQAEQTVPSPGPRNNPKSPERGQLFRGDHRSGCRQSRGILHQARDLRFPEQQRRRSKQKDSQSHVSII